MNAEVLKSRVWLRCDAFPMCGSPEVYCVTSAWLSVPKKAASVVLSARLGYKSNTPHLSSTLQLAQPQLARGGEEKENRMG